MSLLLNSLQENESAVRFAKNINTTPDADLLAISESEQEIINALQQAEEAEDRDLPLMDLTQPVEDGAPPPLYLDNAKALRDYTRQQRRVAIVRWTISAIALSTAVFLFSIQLKKTDQSNVLGFLSNQWEEQITEISEFAKQGLGNPVQGDQSNVLLATAKATAWQEPEQKNAKAVVTAKTESEPQKQEPKAIVLLREQQNEARSQLKSNSTSTKPAIEIIKINTQAQTQAQALTPYQQDRLESYIRKAYLAFNKGQLNEAERDYRKAYQLSSGHRDVLLGLAAISAKRSDYKTAIPLYQKVLDQSPYDPAVKQALSLAQQRHFEAINEQSLAQQDNDYVMGLEYTRLKRWNDAVDAFSRSLRKSPQNAAIAYNLALSYEHLGQHNRAFTYYQKAIKNSQQDESRFNLDTAKQRMEMIQASL